uniref:Uncharacterized protein n=1 Tax=Anopheles quadriannulatus TaxID=34691 RepID=A0A182XSS0_ANOQN
MKLLYDGAPSSGSPPVFSGEFCEEDVVSPSSPVEPSPIVPNSPCPSAPGSADGVVETAESVADDTDVSLFLPRRFFLCFFFSTSPVSFSSSTKFSAVFGSPVLKYPNAITCVLYFSFMATSSTSRFLYASNTMQMWGGSGTGSGGRKCSNRAAFARRFVGVHTPGMISRGHASSSNVSFDTFWDESDELVVAIELALFWGGSFDTIFHVPSFALYSISSGSIMRGITFSTLPSASSTSTGSVMIFTNAPITSSGERVSPSVSFHTYAWMSL